MNTERLLKIIEAPVITEKSTLLAENHDQIVFNVVPDATKSEIKAAVEHLFNVEVKSVQVLNQKGKTKRFGQYIGRRKHTRKAYVVLKEGQELDFTEVN
ncbi:MAG TPA: 50S ribosomal protein L23 [Burkholderiaceae bacterium]|nr:50S ribosomal protein L23 [Burkholderiaceae bacterium]